MNQRGGFDGFNVIGIKTPHPTWLSDPPDPEVESVHFGIHIGEMVDGYSTTSATIEQCGGSLTVCTAVPSKSLGIASESTPPRVTCSDCNFFLLLHREEWKSGVFKWMQMAVSTAMVIIMEDDWRLMRYYSRWLDGPHRFLPERKTFISSKATEILDKYALAHTLGIWPNFRVVTGLLDLQDQDSSRLLLVDAWIIMAGMEDRFQDASKRTARLVSSASEEFHPRTRRLER